MLPGQGKFGVVISKIPVMQSGLKVIFNENLPDYELSFCRSHDELTLLQLRRAVLVVADISGEIAHPRAVCERYYSLMTSTVIFTGFLWSATASIRWPLSY